MKKTFNMVGSNFAHAPSSTWYKTSKYITWEYGTRENPISFYLDNPYQGISEKNDGKLKFLWGVESPKYNNDFIHHCKINLDEIIETYEMIFTYSDELIGLHPKFKFIPGNGFWIEESKIYEKTKLTSMICSHKNHTPLQQFRVDFANKNKDKIDVMGHLCRGLQTKEEGLIDYMFSVCIENDEHDTYFTEKILDAFATGTIPVYKGTRNVANHFNKDGILFLDDINLEDLTPELYYSKMESIKDNFDRVQPFYVLENWMYETHIKNYV